MKNLETGELVYLENDREYTTIITAEKDNYNYAYLVTTEAPYKVKFAKIIPSQDDIDLEIVQEPKLKEELLKLFQEKLSKINL